VLTTQILLPFKINVNSSNVANNITLNVQLELIQVRDLFFPLEDVNIKIAFPENFQNSNLSVNIGDFDFRNDTKMSKEALWNISKLEKGVTAALKGNLIIDNSNNTITQNNHSCVLIFSCKIDKFSISGGAVTKGTITKNPKNLDISKKGKNVTYIKNIEIVF
jgi:hypothetical protein